MNKSKKKVIVVGAGVGGLAVSALLARKGWHVTVLEKNSQTGGKARLWEEKGFRFDMGPSWYLMPEVFEHFFSLFGKRSEDYYSLVKLDPSYKVFFGPGDAVEISPDLQKVAELFESFEPNGRNKLKSYLQQAQYKYEIAMKEFLYKSYDSIFDFLNRRIVVEGSRLNIFRGLDRFVRGYFTDQRARQILEYAMIFLGTNPREAPALYSIMSHVDLNLGVYYPHGGLAAVAAALKKLAESEGVTLLLEQDVNKIVVNKGRAESVVTQKETFDAHAVVVNADYAYAETQFLDENSQSFSARYWKRKTFAPSMFILYLGLNKKLKNLAHHNLYFSSHWEDHFDTIFKHASWPQKPCFYVSCITKTDPAMAPEGHENVFVLIPVAPGLNDTDEIRERFTQKILFHIERIIGEKMRDSIVVKRIYSHRDFFKDYNAYRGTALGIAHTLLQTAVFRPPLRSKKVPNLYYVGQYTHPGIGVPMVLISAELVSNLFSGAKS